MSTDDQKPMILPSRRRLTQITQDNLQADRHASWTENGSPLSWSFIHRYAETISELLEDIADLPEVYPWDKLAGSLPNVGDLPSLGGPFFNAHLRIDMTELLKLGRAPIKLRLYPRSSQEIDARDLYAALANAYREIADMIERGARS